MKTRTEPLPMTVLAGFLGSGKTTLVNHLLRLSDGRRIMVLVNDFGELPIDQDLIEAKEGDVLTLANGCACCSMGADLYKAFSAALDFTPAPDHLLIEASGVAEPKKIANFARAEPDLALNGIITMVDAANFGTTIDDPRLMETVKSQISGAHMILLNKCDLASPEGLANCETAIRKMNGSAPIIHITQGALASEIFFGERRIIHSDPEHLDRPHTHVHEDDFARWTMVTGKEIDKAALRTALQKLPPSILRVKGIFQAMGENRLWIAHKAGAHVELTSMPSSMAQPEKLGFVAIGVKGSDFKDFLDTAFTPFK
jgi:G3E family GTPase